MDVYKIFGISIIFSQSIFNCDLNIITFSFNYYILQFFNNYIAKRIKEYIHLFKVIKKKLPIKMKSSQYDCSSHNKHNNVMKACEELLN